MIKSGGARAVALLRGWPMAALPPRMIGYLLVVEVGTVAWAAHALTSLRAPGQAWLVFALLGGLAVAFELAAARAARLSLRLSSDLKRDMTSVWSVAAIVALPTGQTVLLNAIVLLLVWREQHRRSGQKAYRGGFAACSALLGVLTGSLVLHSTASAWQSMPWALTGAVSVLVAIAVHTITNRTLITLALFGVGVRGRTLLGSRDDNLTELATLCLGGLVAMAALHQPWLCVLVIAPMVALQRGAMVRELETAATTDAKTGLLNAVAWEHLAKREIARAQRERYGVGLLIIDVDRFKIVNDRFGHLAGDAVLRGVGKCLEASMREYDAVGRFGGEEFVAVLPNADESEALVVAERTRAKVNQLRVSDFVEGIPEESDLVLAVSIGVSCMPVDGDEMSDLLHAADGALYRAKAMGRNRVVLADRGAGDPFVRVSMN